MSVVKWRVLGCKGLHCEKAVERKLKVFSVHTLWSEVCKWICMWWYLWRCCWEGWESLTLQLPGINWIRHEPNNSLYERYWKRSKCWMTDTAIPITLHLYMHRKCSEEEEVRVWWRHLFYHCDWANEYCNLERKMKQYMISRSAHRRTVQARRWWPRWRWWH